MSLLSTVYTTDKPKFLDKPLRHIEKRLLLYSRLYIMGNSHLFGEILSLEFVVRIGSVRIPATKKFVIGGHVLPVSRKSPLSVQNLAE